MLMDSWEIECCQPPPGVGDVVAWRLRWLDAPDGPGRMTIPWRTTALRPAGDGEAAGLLLERDGVTAWWPDPVVADLPPVGELLAEAHVGVPEEVPATEGTVVAVHVVRHLYRRTARGFEPVAGTYTLRAVDRSPRWFDPGRDRSSLGEGGEPSSVRAESGVLVDLRIGA